MNTDRKINRALLLLLILSAGVRAMLAWYTELGYDEVYYWTYARYPDLSHFDHPPMVGWIIRIFSLNLMLQHEFFLRLGPVVIMTVNTWLVFLIGRLIRNPMTGFYAALMYTASFYAFVISGLFILPDAPQSLFWLLTVYLLLKALPDRELTGKSRNFMLLAGVTTGLALLSKYHGAFLIAGVFGFVLFHNKKWFTAKETWFALVVAVLIFMPVIIWNYRNDFASFMFHQERVVPGKAYGIAPEFFLRELGGEVFYNNPVVFVLAMAALIALARGKTFLGPGYRNLILWLHLPVWIIFLLVSLFRPTLPHWTGPAFTGFIFLAAARLDEHLQQRMVKPLVPVSLRVALTVLLLALVVAVTQAKLGWIPMSNAGIPDFSKDISGWRQLGEKAPPVLNLREKQGLMKPGSPLFTFRWFPAANFDYYLGEPTGRLVYGIGYLDRIHKYYWINQLHGNLSAGTDAWFIGLSDDYHDAAGLYSWMFDSISAPDTVNILRNGEIVRQAYLFRLKGLKEPLEFPIIQP